MNRYEHILKAMVESNFKDALLGCMYDAPALISPIIGISELLLEDMPKGSRECVAGFN